MSANAESKGIMKAVRVHKPGDSSALVYEDVPIPEPGPGQVLVQIAYTGINFIDTYHRTGLYPLPLPATLGREASGIVKKLGEGVTNVQVGARVAVQESGGYAEYGVFPAQSVVELPAQMSLKDGAAAMLQGLTAHYLATTTYPLKKGDRALVHAGAGGTGGLLIQIAKVRGATVFTTVSNEEKAKVVHEAGADVTINYAKEDFQAKVKELSEGKGVNVVYDGVGKSTWEKSLGSLAPLGMLVLFGNASGPVPPVDPLLLTKAGSVTLARPSLVHYIATPEALHARVKELFGWIAEGKVKVRIAKEFPLSETKAAHEYLESRAALGKILLVVNANLQ